MEMTKKQIRMNRIGKKIMDQFIIENDYNVPDNKPDMGAVIRGQSVLKIEEIKRMESYVKVLGKLEFCVLYLTESSVPELASMGGEIPFEEMIYVEDGEEGGFQIQAVRTDLHVSMIHSRKLEIKAVAELALHRECADNEEIVSEIETEKPVFQKSREANVLELFENKRDIFRMKGEIVLLGTKENVEKLIWQETYLRKMDTKLTQGKMNISGELLTFCIYKSQDGKIDWIEQGIPFQGEIACQGVDESYYHHVYRTLGDIRVESCLDEDGEPRKFLVEAAIELRILIYEEKQMQFLEDIYSLNEACNLEKKRIFFEEIVMQNHSKCKLAEQLSLPEVRDEMLQICHSSGVVQVEKMEIVSAGIQVEGILHVDFMYVKANDQIPFGVWSGMIPFSFLVECEEGDLDLRYDITYGLEQLAVELAGTGEIEIKAVLAFQSFIRKANHFQTIDTIAMEPFEAEKLEKNPGIIGYMVKKGDDLWELAKKYHTTESSIMEINSLSSNCLKEGDKLLIFKENASIL